MINPMDGAGEFFIDFFNNLPIPIKAFVFLCIGLYVISVIVHLIFR